MYIRSKPFSPGSSKVRVQIIESVRNGSKVSQQIVRHVGVAHDAVEEEKMHQYARELIVKIKQEREDEIGQGRIFDDYAPSKPGRPSKKDISKILPTNKVKLADLRETQRVVEGVHEVGSHVFEQLNFDKLLERKRDKNILLDIVLGRMVKPESKLGLKNLLKEEFDKEHDLDAIYRMMDKIHPHIPKIKQLCFQGSKNLIPNQKVSMAFFDVTTLYFESIEADDLRKYGYSKDHRFNTTQVVLALATNEDGLPLGYELFSGNTAEVKTLLASIESWKSYLNIQELCFVADRAMFSKSNLETLDASGYKYVIAAKLRALDVSKQNEILNEANYMPTILGSELAWLGEFEHFGKRLITSYKPSRAKRDLKNREKIVEKIEKNLGKKEGNGKKLINNSGVKKYTTISNSKAIIDESKIALEAKWDGLHGIISNDKEIDAKEAISLYNRLWVIEASFRINKHNLEMRPIYHWSQKRIESHIALCYMSFTILRHIEYKVSLLQKISPKKIMDLLFSVQSSILEHKITKDKYRMPGAMRNEARKIYKAFNLNRNQDPEIYVKTIK